MHFLLKVQTFLALITEKNNNQQKNPTNLKRAKEVLKAKKKWKKYYFPAKLF